MTWPDYKHPHRVWPDPTGHGHTAINGWYVEGVDHVPTWVRVLEPSYDTAEHMYAHAVSQGNLALEMLDKIAVLYDDEEGEGENDDKGKVRADENLHRPENQGRAEGTRGAEGRNDVPCSGGDNVRLRVDVRPSGRAGFVGRVAAGHDLGGDGGARQDGGPLRSEGDGRLSTSQAHPGTRDAGIRETPVAEARETDARTRHLTDPTPDTDASDIEDYRDIGAKPGKEPWSPDGLIDPTHRAEWHERRGEMRVPRDRRDDESLEDYLHYRMDFDHLA
ncbi:hypothetical protein OZX73_08570 [Bifidobacterium sp. ESL0775]|uniref:hypothetical protein n=1 Tax=Bifidobacterium sp. ESL0775 TaxID=2983230 RepID=UPI0023F9BF87|nr:hypothetical protein [Bifidobacterium sp. ESL0775]WEV69294.1 hypothetical protein OZX73_08570 [Bifidobacterium sp. ESL0775]